MTESIGRLIRTNIALAALCIIALGALVSMFRGHTASTVSQDASAATPVMAVSGSVDTGKASDTLARSPFKNMPAPSTYQTFSYRPGTPVAVSGSCSDAYRVIMIFPADIDYRADPSSAVYNDAAPCEAGHPFIEHINLDSRPIVTQAGVGAHYYVIRANEGRKGSWYGPY